MRFVLRIGTREVLFFERTRFLKFDGPDQAVGFLADYVSDPKNLTALREAVRNDPELGHLTDRNAADMTVRVARMMERGELNVLADAEALPPWAWRFPLTPSHVQFDAGAEGDEGPPLAEDDEGTESEQERTDVKPEPVIPPVYPQVADLEAAALEFETLEMNAVLTLLMYVGHAGGIPSEIAVIYEQVAHGNGIALAVVGKSIGAALEMLINGGQGLIPDSQLAHAYQMLASGQGEGLLSSAGTLGEALAILLGNPEAVGNSALGPALLEIAQANGGSLTQSAGALGAQLAAALADGKLTPEEIEALKNQPKVHIVKPGDTLSSIAVLYGLGFAGWQAIYDDARNSELREKRPNPDLIQPGDEIVIPTVAELQARRWIEIVVTDSDGAPRKGEKFRLETCKGQVRKGAADNGGLIRLENVDPGPCKISFPDLALPWRLSTNDATDWLYTVQKGDSLSKIAKTFKINSWRAIYDHPANAEFRKKRPNPDLIHPGDVLFIPGKAPEVITLQSGQRHRVQVILPKHVADPPEIPESWVKFQVIDDAGKPVKGVKLKLKLANGEAMEVETNADGRIELADLPSETFDIEGMVDSETLEVYEVKEKKLSQA